MVSTTLVISVNTSDESMPLHIVPRVILGPINASYHESVSPLLYFFQFIWLPQVSVMDYSKRWLGTIDINFLDVARVTFVLADYFFVLYLFVIEASQ